MATAEAPNQNQDTQTPSPIQAEAVDSEEDDTVSPRGGGGLTSPEAVIMLPFALFLDIIGIILNILLDLNIITDIIGMAIIGLWALNRSGDISMIMQRSKGKSGTAAEITKQILKKFGTTFLIKIIPEVGSFFSFWTYRVYKELKNS